MSKNHYTYRTEDPETGEFYIGVRSCKCDPEDDNYIGSMVSWKPENPSRLKREIINDDFDCRWDAEVIEHLLVKKFFNHEKNRNGVIPDPWNGFHSYSIKDTPEYRLKLSKAQKARFEESIHPSCRSVLDLETGMIYTSLKEASDHSNISADNISNHCRGVNKIQRFLYMDELPEDFDIRDYKDFDYDKELGQLKGHKGEKNYFHGKNLSGKRNGRSKAVRHIESGKEFDTAREAGEYFDISFSTVGYHCRGRYKNQKFEFID